MGQQGRRRDFSEFGAKLEKHIEKLPDYAVRAQEKLQKVQKYFPPADQAGGKPAPQRPRPNPLQRPPVRRPDVSATFSTMANQVPAFAEARAKWDRWNHPAAKLERRKRRTSRAMTLWIMLTILCGVLTVAAGMGWMSATGAPMMPQAITAFAGAVVFGTFGVRSGLKLRELKNTALPAAPAGPPPLPPAGSVAREPMERLAECEASLAELLRQLSVPSSVGTTPVSEVSVADARQTATEAAAALRGLAGRIQAIERGRNSAPAREQAALDAAVGKLREQLDDGLEGYRGLVAAAGHTVAASSDGLVTSKQALTDATDHLAGLAMALRELS
ncbi:phage shock envelope stress response protein PspM [Amycolatopsis sp. MEPSY49]|uniref:phage shock envelope stress response protein PspM n=1 Tax=Amycolatopsis sp. MEPSY49 TaxID=3151600 RepID=UPI003EF62B93